jgi:hypothetical protein
MPAMGDERLFSRVLSALPWVKAKLLRLRMQ